ncbi:unnamed protein product [Peronospora belbahrii]|uniref:Vesicle transport v-SNARE N-terminal domain-containing protein n=1 Tax=Peronospora belbahrii TaxID=622444 RepID=A0AAU9KM98_9STRA|nr:unnamed protein product [Peronospora belbahrii]
MTMTVFDGYYKDYDHARQEAFQAIDEYKHTSNSTEREHLAVTAKSNIDEVERYIRILDNEAKVESSPTKKRKMMEKVHHCRTKWTRLKSSLEKELLANDVRAGKSSMASVEDATTVEQLESCTERVERTGRHLEDAQRILAHTEAIAENVANNLLQQRNQLEHTELNIAQTQDDTMEAKRNIPLVTAIVLVSYFKWYPRDQKDYLGILPNSSNSSSSTNGEDFQ